MMKNSYYKQNGIILPVVLIFFSVLMLLGVTFLSVSGFQVQQSVSKTNRSQAYYIAKSSAESFAEYLIDQSKISSSEEWSELLEKITDKSSSIESIGNATVVLHVQLKSEDKLTVKADAEYMNEKKSAEVMLRLGNDVMIPSGKSVVIVDNPDSVELKPNADFDENLITYSVKDKYPDVIYQDEIYPMNIYPFENPFSKKKMSFTIEKDSYYDSISIDDKNSELIIDLKYGTRVIRVNHLNVGGDIKLINTDRNSRLIIFVEEEVLIGTNNKVGINLNGAPENLIIVTNQSTDIVVKNKLDFRGILYAPNSSISFQTHSNVEGAIVTHSLSVQNNTIIKPLDNDYTIPGNEATDGSSDIRINYDDSPWN
ncbi:hypothetical protein J3A84_13410 [Proteiniclasticum sp. SCR006]|uniref:DUF7305 domain-containing protein n=1 Tax=Proteiniclasticum aestuarii TaxID=2817862 RepID=A0A939HEE5_9CLOT|nr:hypothetical protein [Proteiniclasticum aestuarii]MBO1266030.1 hypothetical protein [Proteiniclasticum aestuarii]